MTQVTINLTSELITAIDQAADERGFDRDKMIIDLIHDGLVGVSMERFNKEMEELRRLDRERNPLWRAELAKLGITDADKGV